MTQYKVSEAREDIYLLRFHYLQCMLGVDIKCFVSGTIIFVSITIQP